MPALNMGLRQKIADMIAAGFEDKEIRKECPTAQSIIAPMHRIIELGRPLNTSIRRDGSIGTGPRFPPPTEEEQQARRAHQLEYRREWEHKHRRKPAFEFTEESDGALNITLAVVEQKPTPRKEKPKTEKNYDVSQSVLGQVKEFSYTWELLLGKENWSVSKDNSESVLSGLKELRTLTSRMIKRVEELTNE